LYSIVYDVHNYIRNKINNEISSLNRVIE